MNIQTKLLLYGIVLASLGIATSLPQFNVLVCAIVATFIIIRHQLDLFPLLILTNIPITSFFFGGGAEYGTFEYTLETYEKAYIHIGGLPISAGLVTVLAMAFVCYGDFLNNPDKFYPGKLKLMFILWNVGALFAVLIALNGLWHHSEAWSGPLRAYLSTSGLFYGYAAALRSPRLKAPLIFDFLIFFLFSGLFAVLGVFHHRILFLGAGFVPGLALIALRRKELLVKMLGTANLIIWAMYALAGFSMGEGTTFTLISLFILSAFLGVLPLMRLQATVRLSGKLLGYPAVLAMAFYMCFAIYGAKKISMAQYVYGGVETTVFERIKFKIFDDRASLWGFVLEDIMQDSKILPVPGESLMVIHPKRGATFVRHGAHNSYLQALRENGFISGGILILLMIFALVCSANAYGGSVAEITRVFAVGSITSLTVGAVTGHYVIGQTIGAFIFMLGGIAMAGEVIFKGSSANSVERGLMGRLP